MALQIVDMDRAPPLGHYRQPVPVRRSLQGAQGTMPACSETIPAHARALPKHVCRPPQAAALVVLQELWAFLFTGFGGFFALISVAVVFGAAVLLWWSRKID